MDKSIPPVIKTKDCQIPIIIMGATCLNRFIKFSPEKNKGFIVPKTAMTIINAKETDITCPIPLSAKICFQIPYKLSFLFMLTFPSNS